MDKIIGIENTESGEIFVIRQKIVEDKEAVTSEELNDMISSRKIELKTNVDKILELEEINKKLDSELIVLEKEEEPEVVKTEDERSLSGLY